MPARNLFGLLAQEHTNSAGDAHLVSGSKVRWRREFNDDTLAAWEVSKHASMTITAGATTTGALQVQMGTTANAESTVTSLQEFTAPFRAQFGVQLNSKIANNEVYLEIVAVNEDGTVDETCVAAWRIAGSDSTTTTNARTEVRNGGDIRLQSGNIASQATQTSASIYEIVLEADEVRFYSKTADSSGARTAGQVRNTVAPDPNRKFRLRYRFKNGSTAPASNTTFTSAFATAVDYTEQQVEVSGGNGSINADQSVPVYNTGGSVSLTTTSLSGSASTSVVGATVAKILSAATTNLTLVKSTAGKIYGYHLANNSASWRYVQLYNKTTAPLTTDVPIAVIPLAPGAVITVDRSVGINFSSGIGYAIVGGPTDTDATAVGVNEVVGHLLFV